MDSSKNSVENKHLAWFLGPKGENARYFEEILIDILRDYIHWRKNYFPEDDLLFSKSHQKGQVFDEQIDSLYQGVYNMMGDLKRNFPFYSPRYMGHMLSDVTMPSMLGYFAGMLFNANNVTSEASPVAAEWEIESSNALINMIGYEMSPKPPYSKDLHKEKSNKQTWKQLAKELKDARYAWGHITAGGTIANIEALWVARNVKYLSLGLFEAYLKIRGGEKYYNKDLSRGKLIIKHIAEFEVAIKKFTDPDDGSKKLFELEDGTVNIDNWLEDSELREKDELRILNLKIDLAIGLLQTFYNNIGFANENDLEKESKQNIKSESKIENAIHDKNNNKELEQLVNKLHSEKKIKAGLYLLSSTKYYNDLPGIMSKYSPIIFAPCTTHYSISKAADILGIPRNNVKKVKVDASFRMNIEDLDLALNEIILQNKKLENEVEKGTKNIYRKFQIPLAVIGVCGTTEEGAVDPIHKILEKRAKFEDEHKVSFWIHADGAYGGFFASLLHINKKDILEFRKKHLETHLRSSLHDCCREKVSNRNKLKNKNEINASIKEEEKKLFTKTEKEFIEDLVNYEKKDDKNLIKNSLNYNLGILISWYLMILENDGSLKEDQLPKFFKIIESEHEGNYEGALSFLEEISKKFKKIKYNKEGYSWNESKLLFDLIQEKIKGQSDQIKPDALNPNSQNYSWADQNVFEALLSLSKVDSVTIDPHKLGYVQYPCGFIGFKSDKVRNFIKQGAPYITSSGSSELNPQPPRHLEDFNMERLENGEFPYTDEKKYKVAIDAFAPYILEGSKPAAAAASLWLTTNLIKPNIDDYGKIIINSIRTSNELYNGIEKWDSVKSENLRPEPRDIDYKIINLTDRSPDTNVIVFFIKPIGLNKFLKRIITLNDINKATLHVYNKFHISAEHGDRKTSYSQEFFISKTKMSADIYDASCLNHHVGKGKAFDYDDFNSDYNADRLEVLRMAIMNPYIHPYKILKELNLIDKFLKEVDEAMKTFKFDDNEITETSDDGNVY